MKKQIKTILFAITATLLVSCGGSSEKAKTTNELTGFQDHNTNLQ